MRKLNKTFDYLTKDYEGFKQEMIAKLKEKMPEYTDISETDAGIVLLELSAVGLDILSAYLDSQANESVLTSAQLWSSVMKWAKILSYTPRYATPTLIKQKFVLKDGLTLTENFVIPVGTKVATNASYSPLVPIYFETIEDIIVTPEDYHTNNLREFEVNALQGVSIYNEEVGRSNGTANQSFSLQYSPAIISDNSLTVRINGVEWERAEHDSFAGKSINDECYILEPDENGGVKITFGSGRAGENNSVEGFGKIPPYDQPIIVSYRIGGGSEGNVPPNTVTTLVESLADIESTTNTEIVTQGYDREDIESIKTSAPAVSRNTWGALTLSDFDSLTKANMPNVVTSKAYRGDEVDFEYVIDEGLITEETKTSNYDDVVIYLLSTHLDSNSQTVIDTGDVSEENAQAIQDIFAERKLVGMNNIFTVNANVITPAFKVKASFSEDANETTVKADILSALKGYFALGNIEIAETLYMSDIESYVLENVSGLVSFRVTQMTNYSGTLASAFEVAPDMTDTDEKTSIFVGTNISSVTYQ